MFFLHNLAFSIVFRSVLFDAQNVLKSTAANALPRTPPDVTGGTFKAF